MNQQDKTAVTYRRNNFSVDVSTESANADHGDTVRIHWTTNGFQSCSYNWTPVEALLLAEAILAHHNTNRPQKRTTAQL